MREVITFAKHGHAPSGTLHTVHGGWAYGYPRTNLFSTPLADRVETARAASFFGKVADAPKAATITKTPSQPPVVSVTTPSTPVLKEQAKAASNQKAAEAKTAAVAAKVHAAIAKGQVPATEVAKRAEKAAAHAEHLELAVHGAYNAIALLQAKLNAQREAGKSQAAHQRVLNKMRARTDALSRAATRSAATASALGESIGGEVTPGLFYGFGQDEVPATDSAALEEEAAVAVADASNAVAADDLQAADKSLDEAAAYQNQASAVRATEAATGDLFAQVEAALSPGRLPWKAIGVAAALLALARAVSR